MSTQERLNELRARLTPEMEVAVRAAIDTGRLSAYLMDTLPAASVDALEDGQPLESIVVAQPAALAGIEAIIELVGRPPLLIRNNTVLLEPMPELPPETPSLLRLVEKWIPSVGRIEFRNHSNTWGGTGWVIEHRKNGAVVITNRHVAKLVASRNADGTGMFMRTPSGVQYGAAIDFGEEVVSTPYDSSLTAELTRVEYLADDTSADVALLLIEAVSFALPAPLQLVDDTVRVMQGDLVALIGYPAYDPRNDADAQARYFRGVYNVKRCAPGKISCPPEGGVLSHDCSSLGGNSGSPLIRLADEKVVGLHFGGLYRRSNSAVSAVTLRSLLRGARPASVQLRGGNEKAADGRHPARYFEGRDGFNTAFLSDLRGRTVQTPWPGLSEPLLASLACPSDAPLEPNELRYTHFGVKYSAKHKLPLITAVNIDGAAAVRIKRANDRWFADERIPLEIQLEARNFRDAAIDRGHMVRRQDPNWGTPGEARQANDDTFHYVNAVAQHSLLNQGKTLWLGLEDYILDNALAHGFKACVFTGPILRDATGEPEIAIDGAIAPLEFWKVVATLDASEQLLHATAYILSQGQFLHQLLAKRRRSSALEGFVLGAYRTFQVRISDLAEITGYDFSAYIEADPLSKIAAQPETLGDGEPMALVIDDNSDIVVRVSG